MPTSARARASCPAPDQVLDALPVTLSLLPKSYLAEIMTAKNGAPGFRAFVLIGVAAAFCAAFIPKPCVASKLAEVDHPVVCPPQWLPVLLASSSREALSTRRRAAACTPHWVIGNVNGFSDTASMIPAFVTLDGVQIGHPVEVQSDGSRSCDEVAAIGVADGIVRGLSHHIG